MPKTISSQASPCQAGADSIHMLENQQALDLLRVREAVIYQTRYDAFVAKLSSFPRAVQALKEMHMRFDGYRKDGVTPEGAHPLEVARHVGRYKRLIVSAYGRKFFDDVVIACALHDGIEDKGMSGKEIQRKYGLNAAEMVRLVSKDKSDPGFTIARYYHEIANYSGPERIRVGAIVIKGSDRRHNFHTVLGLNPARIGPYVEETEEYVIPMLMDATHMYPRLEGYFADTAIELTEATLVARKWHEIASHRGTLQALMKGFSRATEATESNSSAGRIQSLGVTCAIGHTARNAVLNDKKPPASRQKKSAQPHPLPPVIGMEYAFS